MMRRRPTQRAGALRAALLLGTALATAPALLACDGEAAEETSGGVAPAETRPPDPPPAPEPPAADASEACAQVLVVAWQGAQYASDDVTRSKTDARARAEALRTRLEEGADFAELARAESDAASTAPRGGLMGTYPRDEWPAPYLPIRDAVFALQTHQLSEVVEAPFGWVLARRCPIDKAHTRHILIRYRGAAGDSAAATRTKPQARALAAQLHEQATAPGAEFPALAREHSEDSSAERGGDMGPLGRGRLAPAYEEAAFALAPGAVSAPVETEFGFHVIQRVE